MSCAVVWVGVWRRSRVSGVQKVMGARVLLEIIRSVRERLVKVECVVGVVWFELVRSLGWGCVWVVRLVVTVIHGTGKLTICGSEGRSCSNSCMWQVVGWCGASMAIGTWVSGSGMGVGNGTGVVSGFAGW